MNDALQVMEHVSISYIGMEPSTPIRVRRQRRSINLLYRYGTVNANACMYEGCVFLVSISYIGMEHLA